MFKTFISFLVLICSYTLSAQIRQGVATYFDGIATPYGGCGVPEDRLETPNYVALDVYHSPGNGTMWPRPLTGANVAFMGEFQNGLNCGRWIRVTIEENCIGGMNDGALGQPFCRNGGTWQDDIYSGATMNVLVTDACGDNNAWCRDARYHLDIRRSALAQFTMTNGAPSTNLVPINWNNRQISWQYIPAPNYQGDVQIYMLQASQYYWPAITITNLPNGIHGVQQWINGQWVNLRMNSDMGQSYILEITNQPYTIRIVDASDDFVQGGREYTFTNPCPVQPCQPVTTPVTYTTRDPIPLPVEFIQLKQLSIDKTSYLNWTVNYSEAGRFILQGLEANGSWINLLPIYARSNARQQYQIPQPEGYTIFRIQFVPDSGVEVFSNPIAVHAPALEAQMVSVGENEMKVIGSFPEELPIQLYVYDVSGKILFHSIEKMNTPFSFPLSNTFFLYKIVSDVGVVSGKAW